MYENGKPVDSMKVDRRHQRLPTPLIASIMYYMAYNPYWNAPDHLVRKKIAPELPQAGHGLLQIAGLSGDGRLDEHGIGDRFRRDDRLESGPAGKVHLRIRQKPGQQNSMGVLKFPFPNPQDIYLHDTPTKVLFGRKPQPQQRMRSRGRRDAARPVAARA